MRKREFEILGEKLLDVGASNIRRLLDFDNFENLKASICQPSSVVHSTQEVIREWT